MNAKLAYFFLLSKKNWEKNTMRIEKRTKAQWSRAFFDKKSKL